MITAPHILGGVSATDFLQQYWQRKPLLVRGALRDYVAPVRPEELAGLALESEVESRLVLERQSDKNQAQSAWELRHGPFTSETFQALPGSHWTLLVQALDLWVPEVKSLLQAFDFLPPWRLDDVMASYAVPQGSVGPHFDEYDVFLVQVEGQRRWRIGAAVGVDASLVPDIDLKILSDFVPTQEWLLEPGDMLYLPPKVPHWGIAETECLTFSVGFRSPSLADMLGDLAVEVTAQGQSIYYRDPPLTPSMATEAIDPAFVAQAKRLLGELLADEQRLGDWFARYMTSTKYPDLVDLTAEKRVARVHGQRYVNGEPEPPGAR